MKITIDAAKDRMNVAKHGVSLADARLIEWETAVIWPDTRADYGEPRQAALAYIGLRLFNLETAVERARWCVRAGAWREATT